MSTQTLTPAPAFPSAGAHPIATLGRRYHFSASHRLHSDTYDHATNQAVFGKCNNPHGHGHNYTVELLFRGPVHPTTGMVADLAQLDRFAADHLITNFDHQNLNTLPPFIHCIPSTENLTLEIHRIFRHFCSRLFCSQSVSLVSVHVEETPNNGFTYTGPTAAPGAMPHAPTPEHGTDLVTGDPTPSHSGAL